MKIQLINPPTDKKYGGNSKSGCYPPLSLISIATYLQKHITKIDIEILDGEIISLEKIERSIEGDIVGLTTNILNYRNCLYLSKIAKSKDIKVILGGPYASSIAPIIIKNRPEIDAVVVGDGEKAFTDYIAGKPLEYIDNIVYKKNSNLCINSERDLNLNKLLIPDYSFVNLQLYSKNFVKRFSSYIPAKNPVLTNSQKGCLWRENTGGCKYCRPDTHYRAKSPKKSWEEIIHLVNMNGTDFIWDCSNSLVTDKKWFEEFVSLKPEYINPLLMMYARPNDITPQTAIMLKKINCFQVLMGIDSANDEILKNLNTGKSVDSSRRAAKILKSFDIKLSASIIFGNPGETEIDVNNTIKLIEELVGLGNVFEISAAILFPLLETPCFDMMLNIPELSKKYTDVDLINIEELQSDWVDYFCKVKYERLLQVLEEVNRIVPISSSFGKKVSGVAS
ncbi:MAG: B12-binding domain-containing radical SAM protein [Nanoarchaeota archaeon]|nr:B12-binding domain-containing radical SAM protein [Nanoarchaeota archaeon]